MILTNPIAIAGKRNLQDFKEIADKIGMRFMLMEGNLLGAYRDGGGFVKGDEDDMDLGITDTQFNKFPTVIDELKKIGFQERKRVVINDKLHGGCWERGGNHIDIMRMIFDKDKVFNFGEMGRIRYDYPKDIFETYGKINFLGIEVETVGNIEKYLETRYGNWSAPVSRSEYDYKDVKYSPNVKILW